MTVSHKWRSKNIAHLEMINILVALTLWYVMWAGLSVLIKCNNQAMVPVLVVKLAINPWTLMQDNFRGSVRLFCLFGVLRHFQHCAGHITTGSWNGRGNQYIEFARVVYCKLPTNSKQLPAFPLEPVRGSNPGLKGGSVHLILILMLSMFQGS